MGIFCEINLYKPIDEVYKPGQVVTGIIKYTLDEPMEVEKIVMSLKGIGRIILTRSPGKHETTFRGAEDYIDVDTIIEDRKVELPVGLYQANFRYILPQTLPSSMKFFKYFPGYKVKCSIRYYIRLKFEKPWYFLFNNHFRKEIKVVSEVAPKLLREPVIYGVTKKLIHLFSLSDSIVNIKATIINSAVQVGGKFDVHYEVQNNSHVTVKSIVIKLMQTYTFKAKGCRKVTYEEDVPGTEIRSSRIGCNETQNMAIAINAPDHIYSIADSKIVSRDFLVRIIAKLPLPHRNAILSIPVQVGVFSVDVEDNRHQPLHEHETDDIPPPTYWEAMGGKKNEDDSSDDDEAPKK